MVSLGLGLVRVAFSPCKLARSRAGGCGSEHIPAELLLKCHVRPAGFCNVAGSGGLWAFFAVFMVLQLARRGDFSPRVCRRLALPAARRIPFPPSRSVKTNRLIRKAVSVTDIFVWFFLYTRGSHSCLGSQEASEFPCCNAQPCPHELTQLEPGSLAGGRGALGALSPCCLRSGRLC